MSRVPIPPHPKIVLLLHGAVGWRIKSFLASRHENIISLITHDKYPIESSRNENLCFVASDLKHANCRERIAALKPDLAICAWFGHILKPSFLQLFPSGVLNIHSSWLPYNRGKYPHIWAMINGSFHGVSIHFVEEGIDTGDIICQKRVKIFDDDIAEDVYERTLNAAFDLFANNWLSISQNAFNPISQHGGSYHAGKEIDSISEIHLDKEYSGKEIINLLRARSFKDRSYAYFASNGSKIYVKVQFSETANFDAEKL